MLAVLQRLAVPAVLLGALIAATIAADRLGNDPAEPMGTAVTTTPADTPVYSIRRVPELLTSPRAADELNTALQQWVSTLPQQSCFIVSNGAEVIYEHQPTLPLTPASNLKILTAAAALEALGPDYRFETTIAALSEPDENGLLNGDLYVIGGGDPVLMTDAYRATKPETDSSVHTSADDLADQTIATNIADITGAVVAVEGRYDSERAPESVPSRFLEAGLLGSLGDAIVDQGFVGFQQQYASQVADPPPPLPRSPQPGEQLAANFDDLLEARNVRIAARSRVETEAPGGLVELLRVPSPPLAEIVAQMLTNSDNTTAELLVKELAFAADATTQGSTDRGTLEMASQLTTAGVPGDDAVIRNGSGIGPDNKANCALLHDTLNLSQHKDVLRDAMPVAGRSGTLADRFVGTKGEGRLRAKTGLLARATALSGYFVTDPGVELTFSLIINTEGEGGITAEQVDGWMRPLPDLLAPYPAGPPLVDLGPVGVTEADLAALDQAAVGTPDVGDEGAESEGQDTVEGDGASTPGDSPGGDGG